MILTKLLPHVSLSWTRLQKLMIIYAAVVSVAWIGFAQVLEAGSYGLVSDMAHMVADFENIIILKPVAIRIEQSAYPIKYMAYCYWVLPIYFVCLAFVICGCRPRHVSSAEKIAWTRALIFWRRVIPMCLFFLMMVVCSIYLSSSTIGFQMKHSVTTLAIHDVVLTWCQGFSLSAIIFSFKEIRDAKKY